MTSGTTLVDERTHGQIGVIRFDQNGGFHGIKESPLHTFGQKGSHIVAESRNVRESRFGR